MKNKKKKFSWYGLCSILLSLALLVYMAYHFYSATYKTIETEYALDYTYYETVSLNAFFVRNETPLTTSQSGVIGYAQPNGSKVPAGQVVARVFENNELAAVQAQLDEVNELIEDLTSLQVEGTQLSVNAEVLDSRISQAINRYLSITDRNHLQGCDSVIKELLRLLNKKQLSLGSGDNIAQYLSALQAQKTTLEAQVKNCAVVTAGQSGYFVNRADGCEGSIDIAAIKDVTAEEINSAIQQSVTVKPSASQIGKIVVGNEWYLIAVTNQEVAQQLSLDAEVVVTVPVISDQEYVCSVEAMNINYSADTVALVLKCGQVDPDILGVRHVNVQLRTNKFRGLRVRNDALRVVDGITGVYVVDGISALFKPVELLYSGSDFAICLYDATKSNYLKIFDEVIVGGSGVYDGKVIR